MNQYIGIAPFGVCCIQRRIELEIQKRFRSAVKKVLQYVFSNCLMPCVNMTSLKMCINLNCFNFLVHFKLVFLDTTHFSNLGRRTDFLRNGSCQKNWNGCSVCSSFEAEKAPTFFKFQHVFRCGCFHWGVPST